MNGRRNIFTIIIDAEMRERLRIYSNAISVTLQSFNSVLFARHYASWPAGPMTIRHFDYSLFLFLTPAIFTTCGIKNDSNSFTHPFVHLTV